MNKQLKNILFLDIETVSQTFDYQKVDERLKKQWARKASFLKREEGVSDEDLYIERAGIFAEFGQIIVIGMAFFHMEGDELQLRTKAIKGDNEKELLEEFKGILSKMNSDLLLCAHNGKEFDFPYLSRRMLVNGIPLPDVLNLSGKKPWEVNHLDTMDMWKFGDWKHYTSLDLLAAIFGIESSKSDMDGSMVNAVYHEENGLDKIADYCIQDVIVTAQLYAKLRSVELGEFKILS
ncbi:3'-5' exonuclease [Fulvivirga lutea]|uniref:3'-5' exonuclease n=1 Tax=Fulvivirga lutea TaxID=2810512 RepID=A0A974WH93_9BACT|nr:3'-5' exonuclease [Fulvivirga lutea]QSE98070.1 3'-5' exonuclease [Fulvivirga lutea]